ncbi:MAG: MBL fold metallo-hydrolase [Rhabdochlamydiaceae bacterium]|nr:MBL fold metallo-hydrolase [Candidatus Amphrikana amoebophyrae]
MIKNSLQFLGTGSSMGIPVVGCCCSVCKSTNPKDKRTRSSIILNLNGKKILVDSTPDFRTQALTHDVQNIDGVIITHMHYDHIAGIDDLRVFNYRNKTRMPLLMHRESFKDFYHKYYYLFEERDNKLAQRAKFDIDIVEDQSGQFNFLDNRFSYFSYSQAKMHVLGLRYKSFAYVTDIRDYDDSIFDHLKDVEILVVSALRESESQVHFNIDEAVQFAKKIKAKKTYFIHMAHEIKHEVISKKLPDGIELSYDGLTLELN